jgi:hypothetical protein
MHTRRLATFLLGGWIGCSLLMDFLTLENLHTPGMVLATATAPAAKLLGLLSNDDANLILRYQAAEMNRHNAYTWELVEIALALALLACLFLGTQRRKLPLLLCLLMLVALAFQHFAISPELAYRGRDTDFPPGNTAFGPQSGLLGMEQIYGGVEALKLLLGGVLASYLFVFRSGSRIRKKVDAIDYPDHSHVDG